MRNNVRSFLKKNITSQSLSSFLYKTKFSILFPKYQEKYIKESWIIIQRTLAPYGLLSELDLKAGYINVNTTKNTRDPFVVFRARDFLKLISRSVPVHQAAKIFDDDIYCDIIKISGIISNRRKFLKRRKRLIGVNGTTIKAIELVTQCYVLVQGNTVSCMGKHCGIKQVRKIAVDCILNIHPVVHIKSLIIKNELIKDKRFKNKTWKNFIPFPKEKQMKFSKPLNIVGGSERYKRNLAEEKKKIFYEQRKVASDSKSFPILLESQFLKSYNIVSQMK
nr:rev-interacting protein Rip-1-like protein [Cryptomonas sp.]